MEEIFKPIPDYLKRDGDVVVTHFSPSSLEQPLCLWNFNYLYLRNRRRDVPTGAPAPAGGAVHDAIQSVVCDDVDYKEAIRHAITRLQEHTPRDELDAAKTERYIEDIPDMVSLGLDAMNEVFKEQGDIEFTQEKVLGYEHPRLDVPVIGYADFSTPKSIIELKTKWSRPGAVRKDGSRGFSVPKPPTKPDPAHVRQVAFYRACTGLPPTIIYISARDWAVFDQSNCDELQPDNLQRCMEFLLQAAIVRQNLLKISNDPKVLAGYIQPIWNDFRWNVGDEFLAEAKELWKL